MKRTTLILLLLCLEVFSNEFLIDFGIGLTDYTRTVTTIRDDEIKVPMSQFGVWVAPVFFSDGLDFAFRLGLFKSEHDRSRVIDDYYQNEASIYSIREETASLYLSPRLSLMLSSSDPTFRWYLLSGFVHEGIRYNVRGRIGEEKVDLVKFEEIDQSIEFLSCILFIIADGELFLGVQGGPKYSFTNERFSFPVKASFSILKGISMSVSADLFTGNDNISFSFGGFVFFSDDE